MTHASPYHQNHDHDSEPLEVVERDGAQSSDNTMAIMAHILAFAGYLIPFGHILGPLIVYLVKKDESPYIRSPPCGRIAQFPD